MDIPICPFLTVTTIVTVIFTYLLYSSRVQSVIYVCVNVEY